MAQRITTPFIPGSKRRFGFLDRAKLENPRYFGRVPLAAVTVIGLAAAVLLAIRVTERRGSVTAAEDPVARANEDRLKKAEEERRKLLPSLFEGSLVDSKNGEDFRETFGMRHILFLLGRGSAEEVARKTEPFAEYAAAVAHPDAFRGKWVRIQGLVANMNAVRLDSVFWGETDVYRGFLTQTDGSDAIVFDMPEAPPTFEIRRDLVQIEGIFYRTVRYETQQSKWVEIPYFLVKNFKVVHPAASKSSVAPLSGNAWLLIGAFVIGAAWVAFHRFRRRRPPRGGLRAAVAPEAKPSAIRRAAMHAARPRDESDVAILACASA